MKEKLRQILIKLILPFRRKKEEWLGKFRFSIAFRISLHYLKLLMINGLVFLAVFSLLYYGAEWRSSEKKAQAIIEGIEDTNTKDLNTRLINPYYIQGISLKIVDKSTKEEKYCDIIFDVSKEKKIFQHIYYKKGLDRSHPAIILYEEKELKRGTREYKVYLQYDFSDSRDKLEWLLSTMTVLYMILVYFIIRQGKRAIRYYYNLFIKCLQQLTTLLLITSIAID